MGIEYQLGKIFFAQGQLRPARFDLNRISEWGDAYYLEEAPWQYAQGQ